MLAPFVKAILSGCREFKSEETCHVKEMRIHLHATTIVYVSLVMFPSHCE